MSKEEPQGTADLTPNQRLARDIAEQLVKERLIDESKRAKLELGLAEGSLGPGDWRSFVELAVDRERRRI